MKKQFKITILILILSVILKNVHMHSLMFNYIVFSSEKIKKRSQTFVFEKSGQPEPDPQQSNPNPNLKQLKSTRSEPDSQRKKNQRQSDPEQGSGSGKIELPTRCRTRVAIRLLPFNVIHFKNTFTVNGADESCENRKYFLNDQLLVQSPFHIF